jgi:molybdopterin synthase catalytic subunit
VAIQLLESGLDPWVVLARYQAGFTLQDGQYGATAVFVGTMRDFNLGRTVQAMSLEHYPGMTEKQLEQIDTTAKQRWDILDSLIAHRVGKVYPGDPIVLVAVWSVHRDAAFEASRYLIEELKARAPFWKKEEHKDAARWVEENTPVATLATSGTRQSGVASDD